MGSGASANAQVASERENSCEKSFSQETTGTCGESTCAPTSESPFVSSEATNIEATDNQERRSAIRHKRSTVASSVKHVSFANDEPERIVCDGEEKKTLLSSTSESEILQLVVSDPVLVSPANHADGGREDSSASITSRTSSKQSTRSSGALQRNCSSPELHEGDQPRGKCAKISVSPRKELQERRKELGFSGGADTEFSLGVDYACGSPIRFLKRGAKESKKLNDLSREDGDVDQRRHVPRRRRVPYTQEETPSYQESPPAKERTSLPACEIDVGDIVTPDNSGPWRGMGNGVVVAPGFKNGFLVVEFAQTCDIFSINVRNLKKMKPDTWL